MSQMRTHSLEGGKREELADEFGNVAHCKQTRTHLLEGRKREE